MNSTAILVGLCLAHLGSQTSGPTADPKWQLAFERGDDIWLANADGSHLRRLIRKGELPKWSPDGKRLLFIRGHDVRIFDLAKNREQSVYRLDPKLHRGEWDLMSFCWDPVRPAILVAIPTGTRLELVSISTARSRVVGRILGGTIGIPTYAPAWSPSGRTLAFAKAGDIWVAHRGKDKLKPAVSWERSGMESVDYYDDANRLASLAFFNDGESGVSSRTPFWVDEMAWTADEQKLAFHYQRIGGSGFSQIGYLTLKTGDARRWSNRIEDNSGFHSSIHWLNIDGAFSPRICPDGKTLSFVQGWNGKSDLTLVDWSGKQRKTLLSDLTNPDWRPIGEHRAKKTERPRRGVD